MNKHQWLSRNNKYMKDMFGHILGEIEEEDAKLMPVSNTFEVLVEEQKKFESNKVKTIDIGEKQQTNKESTK